MTGSGQTDITELGDMLAGQKCVNVRMALLAEGGQWRLHLGEVRIDDMEMGDERTWRYRTAAFVERRLPGKVAAALLLGKPQEIAGMEVCPPSPRCSSATFRRLHGRQEWSREVTAWPRTEWTITRDSAVVQHGDRILVGDGDIPSYMTFDAALSAFFYGSPHNSNTHHSDLWRIIRPQRDAWLQKITVAPDLLTAEVTGEDLADAVLELSEPAGHQTRQVTRPGTYTFPLPDGLAPDSLLMLRRKGDWLDLRFFPAPAYGRARDDSVAWEQPGAELDVLLAAGEGQHLEAKREIPPAGENRRKMLKTIAAFASQHGGGTLLIGVEDDDLQIVGLREDQTIDQQMLQVGNMIRDSIEPAPPYTPRVIDHHGKKVLAIEVTGDGRPHAYRFQQKPLEFYVRRGPNTVAARHHEIADGFGPPPSPRLY
jgi:hypothetical protein